MALIILFLAGTFGLAVGSFLNVVIYRIGLNDDSNPPPFDGKEGVRVLGPKTNRIIFNWFGLGGRSYCPHCKTRLKWFELIPVLSFLIQRKKCNSCGQPISWQYPLVELCTAVVFALITWQYFSGSI